MSVSESDDKSATSAPAAVKTEYQKVKERIQAQHASALDAVAVVAECLREAMTYCPPPVRLRIAERLKTRGINITLTVEQMNARKPTQEGR